MRVEQQQTTHLGRVYNNLYIFIPYTNYLKGDLGDGLWHRFSHIVVIMDQPVGLILIRHPRSNKQSNLRGPEPTSSIVW